PAAKGCRAGRDRSRGRASSVRLRSAARGAPAPGGRCRRNPRSAAVSYLHFMRKVKVQPSGHHFDVEEGESVLTAALRQHLVLPYGCRNGACGSCKGRIVEGRVDYGVYQKKALTEEEKAQGKALLC